MSESFRGLMICLFGPDGAGKSSVVRLLAGYLRCGGFRVRVSWMRGSHTLVSVLARFLGLFECFRGSDNPYYGIRVPGSLRSLWVFLEVLSALPVWFFRYLLPSLRGFVVVGDRGLVDLVVWIAFTLRCPGLLRSFLLRAVLRLGLAYSVNVYVRADLSELVRRRGGDDVGLLRLQLALYDLIAEVFGLPVIDTTGRDVRESFRELLRVLRGVLPRA